MAAEAGYQQALNVARKLGDPSAEARELRDLGELVARTRDPVAGRALMQQAIAIFERLTAIEDLAISYLYLARLDRRDGNQEEAITHYRTALSYFEQIHSPYAEEARQALRDLGVEA